LILYRKNKIICNKGPINFVEYGPKLVFHVNKTTLHVKTLISPKCRGCRKDCSIDVMSVSPKDLEIEDNCGCAAMEGIAMMAYIAFYKEMQQSK
jgi:hypothetical protein